MKFLALAPTLASSKVFESSQNEGVASIIDIDKCDGCKDLALPACVKACKDKNEARFPRPAENIPNYFPRKIKEDYSKNKDDISRLTPYNFTFIENVFVQNKTLFIPRRCMHCDNPTCQKICPFGVISKDENNAVDIDENFCFGGAKCRDVCPWGIPQRQAGVGIYLKIAPKLAGGGAMFKCDMCKDLLALNQKPACEANCPKKALIFDKKSVILEQVQKAKNEGKFIYGDIQNGGTSTFYISSIDFESINEAIKEKYQITGEFNAKTQKMGRPHLNLQVRNFINDDSALVKTVLFTPALALAAGAVAVARANKKDKKDKK